MSLSLSLSLSLSFSYISPRSQLVKRAFLSLALIVSFVTVVAILVSLYFSLIETNEESKASTSWKRALALAFSIVMSLSFLGGLRLSQLSDGSLGSDEANPT